MPESGGSWRQYVATGLTEEQKMQQTSESFHVVLGMSVDQRSPGRIKPTAMPSRANSSHSVGTKRLS